MTWLPGWTGLTLTRTIALLAGGLAVMLSVVIVRAETARLAFEFAVLERDAGLMRQQLREKELELARLRDPALIRRRAVDLRLGPLESDADRRESPP